MAYSLLPILVYGILRLGQNSQNHYSNFHFIVELQKEHPNLQISVILLKAYSISYHSTLTCKEQIKYVAFEVLRKG